ncbi:hypothetical protein [Brachybacterium sp.]|uniref:hypothetical protein n=1 Tax=Brachybacterium sp. TaxID=1891286 RepID=UPI002ED4968E
MTTNDYDARLARLEDAGRGDTVTVPDGWTMPHDFDASTLDDSAPTYLRPGDVLKHDGGADSLPWNHEVHGFMYSRDLARIGLDVDQDDALAIADALEALPAGSSLTFDEPRDFADGAPRLGIGREYRVADLVKDESGSWRVGGVLADDHTKTAGFVLYSDNLPGLGVTADDFAGSDADEPADEADEADETDDDSITADPDEDDGKTTVGHVHVRVIPDTDGFVEKIAKVAGEAADAIDAAGFHLDEFQRERVAALEQAVRILESRRSPRTGSGGGVLSSLFAPGTSVPMVGVQDMVDIAAFIADADTGRAEGQA